MPAYEWVRIPEVGINQPFSLDGEILHYSPRRDYPYSSDTVALVRIPTKSELEEAPERVEEDPTCAGKGGDCSRGVDEPGDRCWQHPEDE